MTEEVKPRSFGHPVTIMRGIPGSGKSTWIQAQMEYHFKCSADLFFSDGSEDKPYVFDKTKIGEAHEYCLREYLRNIGQSRVVVDNTNCSLFEIIPYVQIALARGSEVHIVTILEDPIIAHARNIHGVSLEVVQRMHDTLMESMLLRPRFWDSRVTYSAINSA